MTDLWTHSEGRIPYRVVAYENADRNRQVYLRWRGKTVKGTNWRKVATGISLRTADGKLIRARVEEAKRRCEAKYLELVKGLPDAEKPRAPLTIAEGKALAFDPEKGKYPSASAHRDEVEHALDFASLVWGDARTWDSLRISDLTQLWRARMADLRKRKRVGHRGAEITVVRLLAVAQWLRDNQHIQPGACVAPKKWRDALTADWIELYGEKRPPAVQRPRHTLEEMRKILSKAPEVDPRFGLLMALGAELRLGQVVRARRPDLSLEHGTLTIYGAGKKRGTVVHLTAGQLAAVRDAMASGYLSLLEQSNRPDYRLFPGGRLVDGKVPVDRWDGVVLEHTTVNKWFWKAEDLAEVKHLAGRSAYGLRRVAVDAVKALGISREGLMQHGGWTDTSIPDAIYADQKMGYARDEASRLRAKIRGEEEGEK